MKNRPCLLFVPKPKLLLSVTDRVWDFAVSDLRSGLEVHFEQRNEVGKIYVSVVVIILGDGLRDMEKW